MRSRRSCQELGRAQSDRRPAHPVEGNGVLACSTGTGCMHTSRPVEGMHTCRLQHGDGMHAYSPSCGRDAYIPSCGKDVRSDGLRSGGSAKEKELMIKSNLSLSPEEHCSLATSTQSPFLKRSHVPRSSCVE